MLSLKWCHTLSQIRRAEQDRLRKMEAEHRELTARQEFEVRTGSRDGGQLFRGDALTEITEQRCMDAQ